MSVYYKAVTILTYLCIEMPHVVCFLACVLIYFGVAEKKKKNKFDSYHHKQLRSDGADGQQSRWQGGSHEAGAQWGSRQACGDSSVPALGRTERPLHLQQEGKENEAFPSGADL